MPPSGRTRPRRSRARLRHSEGFTRAFAARVARLALVAALLFLAGGGAVCGPASIPERLRELPPDFKRTPYLQEVTPNSAIVVWQTHSPETSTVSFWTGDSASRVTVTDTTIALDHAIELQRLQPDTEYDYAVQTWDGRFTEPRPFRTAPTPGTRKPFKFLVFGDSGEGTQGQLLLADRMPREGAALAIHVGDVAYDNGTEEDFDFRHFAVYKDFLASVPFYPSLGNHDVRTEFGTPYLETFHLPADNPAQTERYYSFQRDNVFFVALDSNFGPLYTPRFGDLRDSRSAQHRWLEDELRVARADPSVDWIVVYMHHPPFSSGRGIAGHGSDVALQRALVPLFDRYRVDVVFSGHDHHYERSFAIRCDGVPVTPACVVKPEDPDRVRQGSGTLYFVTGAGGGPFAWRAVGVNWWTAFARQTYQYMSVEVEADALVVRSIDASGSAIDEVRIEERADRAAGAPEAAPGRLPGAGGQETTR